MTLVEALLAPAGSAEGERFQGTLIDLHIAGIDALGSIGVVEASQKCRADGIGPE